jgi:glutaconyl-CoA/methylmalonyl-CoA decarboxylase subunit delta
MSILLKISFDFSAMDLFAWTISIAGYTIVFIALLLMYLSFAAIPRILRFFLKIKLRRMGHVATEDSHYISGEVGAAIGMAIHLYMSEMHDKESDIITIRGVSRSYSPWSSKIWSVRNYFNRP